jgi:hypothetical protein
MATDKTSVPMSDNFHSSTSLNCASPAFQGTCSLLWSCVAGSDLDPAFFIHIGSSPQYYNCTRGIKMIRTNSHSLGSVQTLDFGQRPRSQQDWPYIAWLLFLTKDGISCNTSCRLSAIHRWRRCCRHIAQGVSVRIKMLRGLRSLLGLSCLHLKRQPCFIFCAQSLTWIFEVRLDWNTITKKETKVASQTDGHIKRCNTHVTRCDVTCFGLGQILHIREDI